MRRPDTLHRAAHVAPCGEPDSEERARLAQELLESVERDADPEVQGAWETEVASRITKYEHGEAKLTQRKKCSLLLAA